jgi:hypothetical protein
MTALTKASRNLPEQGPGTENYCAGEDQQQVTRNRNDEACDVRIILMMLSLAKEHIQVLFIHDLFKYMYSKCHVTSNKAPHS